MGEAAAVRDLLARRALAEIPRILSLQDRTPVSPTYGCFDRNYWHTRIVDFPSGMAQKYVLPLALVWSLDLPGNMFRGQSAIRDAIEAGIRYAARSAHKDGSCDDYYPFERASGAAAFSLIACLDAAEIIGLGPDQEIDGFLKRRGRWLGEHEESGRLSNHEGLIAACLARLGARYGGEEWERLMQARLQRLLSWRSKEGWFDEYGGADAGYLTLTIAQLADLDRRRPELGLREPCAAAIRFVGAVMHPDGSLGGEYTSRNTQNFFPHGLEIAGAWCPEALAINDLGLRPLAEGRSPAWDERLIGHYVTSWLLAWREWREERPGPLALPQGRRVFEEARLLVDGRSGQRLYLATSRGGAFRLFDGDRLLLADTGIALGLHGGKVAVCHLEAHNEVSLGEDEIVVAGRMAYAKSARLTPFKSIALRGLMLTVGRFFPDLIRRLLQKMLVTGRNEAPFSFSRTLRWSDARWHVRDEIRSDRGWKGVVKAGTGGFQSSLTTVMARIWQPAELQPWLDLTDRVSALARDEPLVVERAARP
jgi:hypothetical protein